MVWNSAKFQNGLQINVCTSKKSYNTLTSEDFNKLAMELQNLSPKSELKQGEKHLLNYPWGRILGLNQVLRVFLPAIPRHLNSFALRFLFLQTHATSYSF